MTTYDLIENAANTINEPVARLADWSMNFTNGGLNPFMVFCDLIGESTEHFGKPFSRSEDIDECLDCCELDLLADALKAYAENPSDVRSFTQKLMDAGDDEDEV